MLRKQDITSPEKMLLRRFRAGIGTCLTMATAVGAADTNLPMSSCTGYRPDYSFVRPAVIGPGGYPAETEGAADGIPGLYYVGLIFQRGFYSPLVGGVGRDARFIVDRIATSSPSGYPVAAQGQ